MSGPARTYAASIRVLLPGRVFLSRPHMPRTFPAMQCRIPFTSEEEKRLISLVVGSSGHHRDHAADVRVAEIFFHADGIGMNTGGADQLSECFSDGGDIVHEIVNDEAKVFALTQGIGLGA